jgi:hypothetical protein
MARRGTHVALSGDGWVFMDRVVEDVYCNCVPYSNLE